MTYREKQLTIEKVLMEAGIDDYKTDAGYLMMSVYNINMAGLLLRAMDQTDPELDRILDEYTARRAGHEPLQYILGVQEFMGFEFMCSPACLIPRQDTELLVEKSLEAIRKLEGDSPLKVLDMCTGSGCIAISVALLAKSCQVTAADLSNEALDLAKANAIKNGAQVSFVASDLFTNIKDTFDVIISNPPYIPSGVIPGLMPEVNAHEPMMALDGGQDGLDFYRILCAEAHKYLRAGGYMLVEMDDDQGESVSNLFRANGFDEVMVYKDLTGADRLVSGRRK